MHDSNRLSEEEAIFRRFRPICAALAEKPSAEILSKLDAEINAEGVSGSELTRIQAYIVFPLQLYLRNPILPENYTIKVVALHSKLNHGTFNWYFSRRFWTLFTSFINSMA